MVTDRAPRRREWSGARALLFMTLVATQLPTVALAEQACVRLRSGAETGGELKAYVPGDHLILDSGDGNPVRVAAADVLSVQIHATGDNPCGPAPAATPLTDPPLTAPTSCSSALTLPQLVAVENLLDEQRYWRSRYTGLAVPAVLIPVGVVGLIVGAVLRAHVEHGKGPTGEDRHPHTGVGRALLISGGLTLLVGVLSPSFRTRPEQKAQELRRIRERLRELGGSSDLSAWFQRRDASAGGLAAGLAASVRF